MVIPKILIRSITNGSHRGRASLSINGMSRSFQLLRRFCRLQWKIICSSTAGRNAFLARRLHHQESAHWRSSRTNECQSKQIAGFDNSRVLGIKDATSHLRPVKKKVTMKVFTGAEDLNCVLPSSPHATTRADATCAGWNYTNEILYN